MSPSLGPLRTSRPVRFLLGSSLWASLAVAVPARAQPAPDDQVPGAAALDAARRHFDLGLMFYTSGTYPQAREEFEAAYRLSRKPDLLFNLARVAQRMGRPDDAVVYLERYLLVEPDAPDAQAIRQQIATLRQQGARPAPPQVGVVVAPARPSRLPPWPALALLGGGAALLVLGAGLGGGAIAEARMVSDPRYDGLYFTPELQAAERRGQALNAAAITFDVLGGVALAGGAAWTGWWLHARRKDAAPRPLVRAGGVF